MTYEVARDLNSDYVILGHTCIQDVRRVGLFTLVNPGSVGLSHEASPCCVGKN
jgi:predicted phosphodiesterase